MLAARDGAVLRGDGVIASAPATPDRSVVEPCNFAAERVQGEEVPVPTHNDVGASVHRSLEELVVVGIAAYADALYDFHDVDQRREPQKQCVASFA